MDITCKDITVAMEVLAPSFLAYDWDNNGLLVGDYNWRVKKVLVALDAVSGVLDEALAMEADMIVTHHPSFLFKPVKKINNESSSGQNIIKAIQNKIAVYAAHTNLDIAPGGVNDVLSQKFGLRNIKILKETYAEPLRKLVVYVPDAYQDAVRERMFAAGAGHIGRYADCSFSGVGLSTFKPADGTNPFIGTPGVLENVPETKIETIVPKRLVGNVIEMMKKSHPYEEPAYDVFPVEQIVCPYGIGRIGDFEKEMTLKECALMVKQTLELDCVRIVGDASQRITKAAVCGGSGMEFMPDAKKKGADVFITADVKYHDAQEALALGLSLIDATHYASENIICDKVVQHLQNEFSGLIVEKSKFSGQTFQHV